MDTSAETLQETCPMCKKNFGEGNPSNICKLLKRDKVNVVVAEGLRVHRDCLKWYTNERDIKTNYESNNNIIRRYCVWPKN